MYMAGMVCLPPRGGFALRHFSGAKLRKISETTPPFNDRNIFFLLSKQKKFAKTFGGFMESMYLCTRNQANASIAQLVRAPDC